MSRRPCTLPCPKNQGLTARFWQPLAAEDAQLAAVLRDLACDGKIAEGKLSVPPMFE